METEKTNGKGRKELRQREHFLTRGRGARAQAPGRYLWLGRTGRLRARGVRDPLELHRRGARGATARSSRSRITPTAASRWRTTGAAVPWTGTPRKSATTGSSCTASSTPAASTTIIDGDNYEYSLGLNGLGACATQYASRYMDVTVWRDGNKYSLHFEQGQITGKKGEELKIEPTDRGKKTGTLTRWLPDLDVFTDINIPASYFTDVLQPTGGRQRGHHVPLPRPGGRKI